MKLRRIVMFSLVMLSMFQWIACQEDVHQPSLDLKTGGIYTPDSSVVAFNNMVVVGAKTDGGGVNITMIKLTVTSENGTRVILDSGMNVASLDWTRAFPKGDAWSEIWELTIMNRDRQQISKSFHIFKDSASVYGEILEYPSVILGTQNNTLVRNFFDPVNDLYYFPSEVSAAIENTIDVATYYDASDSYTIFSPGCSESELYYPVFNSWSQLNYTAWDIHTIVSAVAFDAAHNDSLLVASYDPVYGKKKYKFTTPGTLIPFKTAAGKIGILKVVATQGMDIGTIEFALKIQK